MLVKSLINEPDTVSSLTATDMKTLISQARPLCEKEKNLIKVPRGNILAVGDLHGNFKAAKYIVSFWKAQEIDTLVFLGDYIDRGKQQLETINFLLALKLLYPQRVFLLRGNHETPYINSFYGFSSVCIKKFGKKAKRMYNEYNILFSYFSPVLLHKKILLMHGGIPDKLDTLEDINALDKGDLDADNNTLGQILWNDPSEVYPGFELNWERGVYCTYGKEVFSDFLQKHQLSMVIRGHEFFYEGYKFFFENKLLSIFSSPNYETDSKAKMAEITKKGITLIDVKTTE